MKPGIIASPAQHGDLSIHGTGFEYRANAGFTGRDSFVIMVSGISKRIPGQSCAQHRSDAVEPAPWGQGPLGQALHISGGERQKTLPHAWGAPGSGTPRGNKNALKQGLHAREAIAEPRQLRDLLRQSCMLIQKIDDPTAR